MTKIAVTRNGDAETRVPIIDEVSKRLDAVRQRAHELFQKRGRRSGSALEDWIAAERDVFGWPAVELKERDNEFELDVSLAGFDPEEIEVVATDDELVVHAATRKEALGEEDTVVWSEFGANDVYRRVELSKLIDTDGVTAEYDNGLLRIHAPIAAAAM